MPWGNILHGGRAKIARWQQAGERHWQAWSLALEAVVSGASRAGNTQEPVGLGIGAGRAMARIDNSDLWGGLDFLAGDALVAEFDTDKREFWLKETASERTPGMEPWRLEGKDKNIRRAKPSEYVVLRTTKQGLGLSREHVAFRGGELVAHHLDPEPPRNSSMVSDPGEGGDDEREAGLHGLMRVRRFARSFCAKYADKSDEPFYALLLNFARSTGDNSGYGAAHFGDVEANLSYRGGGPLRSSDTDHEVGFGESSIQQAALDVYRHLWGSEGTLFSPAEFENVPWRRGGEGPFIKLVPWREDFDAFHTNHCGKRVQGMKKWMTYADKEWLPTHPKLPPTDDPPPRDPEEPPPRDPIDPGEPGRPVIDPGPIPGRGTPTIDFPGNPNGMAHLPYQTGATNTGPSEEEQPSLRGMSSPNIPDGPKRTGGESDILPDDPALPAAERIRLERDRFWLKRYGFTEREFYAEPRLTEIAFLPQYENTTAGAGPTRWRPKLRNVAVLDEDASGKIIARQAAHGPGGAVVMPGMLEPWHALRAQWGKHVPRDTPESSFVLLNQQVANDDGDDNEVITALGIGSRHLTQPGVVAGAQLTLDYGTLGTGTRTEPDLLLTFRDEEGVAVAGRRMLNADGEVFAYLSDLVAGSGDVSSASNFTDDNRLTRTDTVSGVKNIQQSAVELGDATTEVQMLAVGTSGGNGIDFKLKAASGGGNNGGNLVLEGGSGLTLAGRVAVNSGFSLDADTSGAGGADVALQAFARYRITSGASTSGFTNGVDGRVLIVENATGASHTITHNATSTAANRIFCPGSADITVPADGTVVLCYSGTDSRWRVASIASATGGSGLSEAEVFGRMTALGL